MKCHNSPSCMRYWLLTHSDTRVLFPAENIFEFMDWQQNPLPCAPCDSIYSKWVLCNWKECRHSLVGGMLCIWAAVTHISSAVPRPRQWQEVCGPRHHASFLSPSNQPARMSARHLWLAWRRRQAKSSSCTQTQPFSHQCVSGRQRREAQCARWLGGTCSLPRLQAWKSVVTLAYPQRSG